VIKDVIVAGIADADIRKDVLAWSDLDTKDDKGVVAFVESKEVAQKALTGIQPSGAAAISTYKKTSKLDNDTPKLTLKGKCTKCSVEINLYKKYPSGKFNKAAFKMCRQCHRGEGAQSQSKNSCVGADTASSVDSFFIGVVTDAETVVPQTCSVTLGHHIFSPEGWQRASALSHPKLRLRMTTCEEDYTNLGVPYPKIQPKHIDTVVDSGAQTCLWSRQAFLRNGFMLKDLIPVRHNMKAANAAPINIDGAIIVRLSGTTGAGDTAKAAVMVYISPDTDNFYLSREAMLQLGIINSRFPQLSAANAANHDAHNSEAEVVATESSLYAECGCLRRQMPPEKPARLPFPCTPENAEKMKAWILMFYASSTFNKCPHQKLPEMEGPPIQIHVDPNATPICLKKPAPVPIHFEKQVDSDILRDIAMDVLEPVPIGEPTRWCFKMIVTRKDDGSPRRTIDLSPLNKYCRREVHTTKSPFDLARSVPENSVKSVFDAWNGYHLVPVREEDRHLLTFSTKSFGLLRCKKAPQGYVSSGDGYNRRFMDLTADIARIERCVDDTLLHDPIDELDEHWWRTMYFIELCGRAGIVLNPEKFQFCQNTVDFAGFRISKDTVEPLPKYLDAIRGFPTPKSTTDVRSWFGLVNQVSHYAQLRDMMEPFRRFLSPKEKFTWDDELDALFEESKARIIEAIREGVRIFDVSRHTCLRTDWSKKGIGYLLAQKHCECDVSLSYGCCPDGWKITLAGSRFLSPAEQNYAPVEGEALAVAWALEQTRYFTMGCDDLKVIVDHKPLTKIFGDRRLDEIDNPRLFRLKCRTLMWRFEIQYQRGESNPFADAMSRYPNQYAELASLSLRSVYDGEEAIYIDGIMSEADKLFAITWDTVRAASSKDESMRLLTEKITNGFPMSKKDLPDLLHGYWDVRDMLRCADGVVMYKDRIVIPPSLRGQVTENLHSAHQGVSSMYSRAQTIVYWPGLVTDLEEARNACRSCHRNMPSHAKLPPTAPEMPKTPFQMIFGDYFQLGGKHYLVIGDRLSAWTEVVHVRTDPASSGSKGLCQALRMVIARFGAPEELSSDGGPEFTSKETEDFYTRWGIRHRLSSAYFPQSNGRAEVAVRITKRLLAENVDANGSLNTDNMVRALLQQRNTPDRDCNLSPAEVLFGKTLRDTMPQMSKSVQIFENNQIHSQWHQAWAAKEDAIRARLVRSCEKLEMGSKELPPLREGDQVMIQNQDKSGGRPNKWDRQGTVIASKDYDQYLVKVHGSGRLTLRNRRFLRKFQLRSPQPESSVSGSTPARKSLSTPGKTPMRVPGSITRSQPASVPENVLVSVPDSAVDSMPESIPESVPEQQMLPSMQPNTMLRSPSRITPTTPTGIVLAEPTASGSTQEGPSGSISGSPPESSADSTPQIALRSIPENGPANVSAGSTHALGPTRGRGRPPKRLRWNFHSQPILQSHPAGYGSSSWRSNGAEQENWRAGEHRTTRARKQRQVYDAATGDYKDPIR